MLSLRCMRGMSLYSILIALVVISQITAFSLRGYDKDNKEATKRISRLMKRGVMTDNNLEKRADIPMLCKKDGLACHDDVMGLRMMPNRHPINRK